VSSPKPARIVSSPIDPDIESFPDPASKPEPRVPPIETVSFPAKKSVVGKIKFGFNDIPESVIESVTLYVPDCLICAKEVVPTPFVVWLTLPPKFEFPEKKSYEKEIDPVVSAP
jgi:hypothetical protein